MNEYAAFLQDKAQAYGARDAMRCALDAVRGELCQHEVVESAASQVWCDKDGHTWSGSYVLDPIRVAKYGPLTPVLLVRDPEREVVK